MSRIGLGTASLGRPGYINVGHGSDLAGQSGRESMEVNARAVFDLAANSGVSYLDTARSYGSGEEFLGRWLSDHPGLTPVVGSKWGYRYVADWQIEAEVHEVKDHSLGHLDSQVEESLGHLGSALTLYQIHSATPESGVLEDKAVIARLNKLKGTGLMIGLSTSGPTQSETIERALEIEIDGRLLFDTVQSTWNLLEPSAGIALAAANEAGLGVIVKEAVANGLLTSRGPYADQLASDGYEADAHAIAAALAQPWCSVVLSGATTPEQLSSNLRSLEIDIPNSLESMNPRQYWEQRKARPWT